MIARYRSHKLIARTCCRLQSRFWGLLGLTVASIFGLLASSVTSVSAPGLNVTSLGYRANEGGGGAISTGWTGGNLGNTWSEGEWVAYQLVLDNVQTTYPGLVGLPDIVMSYDFTKSDARFIDLVRGLQAGTVQRTDLQGWVNDAGAALPVTTRAEIEKAQNDIDNFGPLDNVWIGFQLLNLPTSQINRDLLGLDGTPTTERRIWRVTRANLIAAGIPTSANKIVIYFQLHESRTFIWQNHLQSGYNASPTAVWGG
ncbi:MAG TPA: hypothetical protein VGK93_02665, partial [Candidatus Eisenbacteria bacterium]